MDLGLKGQVALVGGASKGLGLAVAEGLAREGVRVAICARSGGELLRQAERLSAAYDTDVIAVPSDLSKQDGANTALEGTVRSFGGVDILVTNAGGPPALRFEQTTDDHWNAAFQLILMHVVRLSRLVAPIMEGRGGGRIINLASISVKQVIENLVLSTAIRAGVIGLAKTLATEFANRGITVNNICPGYIRTSRLETLWGGSAERNGMTFDEYCAQQARNVPLGRIGVPTDIADLVVFLASARAAYITGATIQVDGGLYKGLL
jgi:3-oxoacyl-[acyl-carrier protein] reductase